MLRLRPFKLTDSQYLLQWFGDKKSFTMWSAGKFDYPLTKEQIEDYYRKYEEDEFAWIMIALNEEGRPVGHLLMRMADYKKGSIHFGFIIVDRNERGKGYGKEMVALAAKYAFEILKVKRITLGVYDNNPSAHGCYKAVGFVDEDYRKEVFTYEDEKWGIFDMAYTFSS